MKQTERIHHRCRCLDRNFSFEEWSKYLRENPSGGAVLTVGSFQFNICDVCLTPNHPVRIERNICELDIETAQSVNGRWCYGIHLGLHSESSSHGAQFVDDTPEVIRRRKRLYTTLSCIQRRGLRRKSKNSNREATHPTITTTRNQGDSRKPRRFSPP